MQAQPFLGRVDQRHHKTSAEERMRPRHPDSTRLRGTGFAVLAAAVIARLQVSSAVGGRAIRSAPRALSAAPGSRVAPRDGRGRYSQLVPCHADKITDRPTGVLLVGRSYFLAGLVMLATLGALTAPAGARDITRNPLVQKDVSVALAYWHSQGYADPCRSYAVQTGPVVGWAGTWIGGCEQTWNAELWTIYAGAVDQPADEAPQWAGDEPRARRLEDLRWSCDLTVHEFGHTVGLEDEHDDRRSVMFASFGQPASGTTVLPVCARAFPR